MSIVERAIKKLQVATPQAPATRPLHAFAARDASGEAALPVEEVVQATPAIPDIHIDRFALRAAGLLPSEHHMRRLAGEYRHIKRPLIAAAFGRGAEPIKNGQFMMVASALPGEGKTFTCVNLAMSMALEKDASVVLVDADVAKPHISKVFGVESRRGLLDCLDDERCDPESLILSTDVPRFFVLPAGTRSETAPELLASVRMEKIATQLLTARTDRLLVFDSPPLLLTNESRALAQAAGQIVIVVRAGFTLQKDVMQAIRLVGETKPIGLVLNQSAEERLTEYSYSYGSESSVGEPNPAKPPQALRNS